MSTSQHVVIAGLTLIGAALVADSYAQTEAINESPVVDKSPVADRTLREAPVARHRILETGRLAGVDFEHGVGHARLGLQRTWAGAAGGGHLGAGWYDANLFRIRDITPNMIVVTRGAVIWLRLEKTSEGDYQSSSGASLQRTGDSAVLSLSGGTTMFFEASQVQRIEPPFGRPLQYHYSAEGQIQQIEVGPDNSLFYLYDGDQVARVEGPEGLRAEYKYSGNLLIEVSNGWNEVVRYDYHDDGTLASATDSWGNTLVLPTASATAESVAIAADDALVVDVAGDTAPNRATDTDSDPLESPDSESVPTLPLPPMPQREFDPFGRLVKLTDRGRTTQYSYNSLGQLVTERSELGERSWTYDSFGRVATLHHWDGTRWQYSYNKLGKPTRVESSGGEWETYEYDHHGRVILTRTSAGKSVSSSYDERGRLLAEQPNVGRGREYLYAESDDLVGIQFSDGRRLSFLYDELGRRVLSKWSTGQYQFRTFAQDGRLLSTEADGLVQSYSHDEHGRVIAIHDPVRGERTFNYKQVGRGIYDMTRADTTRGMRINQWGEPTELWVEPTADVNADGNTDEAERETRRTFYQYLETGEVSDVGSPTGRFWSYRYDDAGRLMRVELPAGQVTDIQRDTNGRVQQISRDGINVRSFLYDASGRLQMESTAGGMAAVYSWDPAGRLRELILPSGRVTYTRDERGLVQRLDADDYSIEQEFHADGSLARRNYQPAGIDLHFPRDHAGRAAGVRLGEIQVDYEYDQYSRVRSLMLPGGAKIWILRDEAGRPQEIVLGDRIRMGMTWDGADRLTSIGATVGEDADALMSFLEQYRYDPFGNMAERQALDGPAQRMSYDEDDRLISVESSGIKTTYGYDDNDNLETIESNQQHTRWELDGGGRPMSRDARTVYTWDEGGSLSVIDDVDAKVGNSFDAAGRLVHRQVGEFDWTFGYLPNGDRLWQQSPQGRTWYAYNEAGLLAFIDEQNQSWLVVTLPGTDRPLALCGPDGATLFLITDHLGSIRRILDPAGNPLSATEYGEYGQIVDNVGTAPIAMYAGMIRDNHGLYYARQRYYDPSILRFISIDPWIGDYQWPASHNSYSYAGNNPLRYRDPTGAAADDVNRLTNRVAFDNWTPQQIKRYMRSKLREANEADELAERLFNNWANKELEGQPLVLGRWPNYWKLKDQTFRGDRFERDRAARAREQYLDAREYLVRNGLARPQHPNARHNAAMSRMHRQLLESGTKADLEDLARIKFLPQDYDLDTIDPDEDYPGHDPRGGDSGGGDDGSGSGGGGSGRGNSTEPGESRPAGRSTGSRDSTLDTGQASTKGRDGTLDTGRPASNAGRDGTLDSGAGQPAKGRDATLDTGQPKPAKGRDATLDGRNQFTEGPSGTSNGTGPSRRRNQITSRPDTKRYGLFDEQGQLRTVVRDPVANGTAAIPPKEGWNIRQVDADGNVRNVYFDEANTPSTRQRQIRQSVAGTRTPLPDRVAAGAGGLRSPRRSRSVGSQVGRQFAEQAGESVARRLPRVAKRWAGRAASAALGAAGLALAAWEAKEDFEDLQWAMQTGAELADSAANYVQDYVSTRQAIQQAERRYRDIVNNQARPDQPFEVVPQVQYLPGVAGAPGVYREVPVDAAAVADQNGRDSRVEQQILRQIRENVANRRPALTGVVRRKSDNAPSFEQAMRDAKSLLDNRDGLAAGVYHARDKLDREMLFVQNQLTRLEEGLAGEPFDETALREAVEALRQRIEEFRQKEEERRRQLAELAQQATDRLQEVCEFTHRVQREAEADDPTTTAATPAEKRAMLEKAKEYRRELGSAAKTLMEATRPPTNELRGEMQDARRELGKVPDVQQLLSDAAQPTAVNGSDDLQRQLAEVKARLEAAIRDWERQPIEVLTKSMQESRQKAWRLLVPWSRHPAAKALLQRAYDAPRRPEGILGEFDRPVMKLDELTAKLDELSNRTAENSPNGEVTREQLADLARDARNVIDEANRLQRESSQQSHEQQTGLKTLAETLELDQSVNIPYMLSRLDECRRGLEKVMVEDGSNIETFTDLFTTLDPTNAFAKNEWNIVARDPNKSSDEEPESSASDSGLASSVQSDNPFAQNVWTITSKDGKPIIPKQPLVSLVPEEPFHPQQHEIKAVPTKQPRTQPATKYPFTLARPVKQPDHGASQPATKERRPTDDGDKKVAGIPVKSTPTHGNSIPIHQPRFATVPDVRGLSVQKASEAIARAGLTPAFNLGIPARNSHWQSLVYGQQPVPRMRVAPGTTVRVVFHDKPATRIVPPKRNDVGPKLAGPVGSRTPAGSGGKTTTQIPTKNTPTGSSAAKQADAGKDHAVIPSRASSPSMVRVPDVAGMAAGEASKQLRELGLKPKFESGSDAPSQAKSYKVYQQSPASGERVAKNTAVAVRIYAPYRDQRVRVPNLSGLTFAQAASRLKGLGLSPTRTSGEAAPSKAMEARIYKQSPSSGQSVDKGTSVAVTVYDGVTKPAPKTKRMVRVPAFTGVDYREGIRMLEKVGLKASVTRGTIATLKRWEDVVYYYEPYAGKEVPLGSTVDLKVYSDMSSGKGTIGGPWRCQCGARWTFVDRSGSTGSEVNRDTHVWNREIKGTLKGLDYQFRWTADSPQYSGGTSGTGKIRFNKEFTEGHWTMTNQDGQSWSGIMWKDDGTGKRRFDKAGINVANSMGETLTLEVRYRSNRTGTWTWHTTTTRVPNGYRGPLKDSSGAIIAASEVRISARGASGRRYDELQKNLMSDGPYDAERMGMHNLNYSKVK